MPLDNQQELFYWVDANDSELGSITRAEAHDGTHKIHRSIIVIITTKQGEMLLQQRSLQKDKEPGLWSCAVGGHLTYGQTYDQAALRETEEELGIKVKPKKLHKILIKKDFETEYSTIYLVTLAKRVSLTPDPTEVEQVAWVPTKELKEFITINPTTGWTFQALKETNFID